MSKVHSFRLDAHNPREAKAKGVIDTWLEKGYPLRYLVVETLISYKKVEMEYNELSSVVDQLRELILSLDTISEDQPSDAVLPNSILLAVKKTAMQGITSRKSTTYGFEGFGLGVCTVYMLVLRLWSLHYGVLVVQIVHSLYCFYTICTKLHQKYHTGKATLYASGLASYYVNNRTKAIEVTRQLGIL